MKKFSRIGLIMGLTGLLSINVFGFTFADVPENHWAYKSINYMQENGYMTVNSEGNFLPNTKVSYFNIAELLAKAAGYQDENIVKTMDETFKLQIRQNYANWEPYITAYDEKYTVWETTANEEIAYLLGKGILKQEDLAKFVGKTKDGQEAKRVLTKEDLSVYLVRLLGKEQEALQKYTGTTFKDEQDIKEENRAHVAYLNSLGVVNGDTEGNFGANTGVIRSVCAKMVAQVLQMKEELAGTSPSESQQQDGTRTGIVTKITPKNAQEYFILIDQDGVTNWATIREETKFLTEDNEALTLSDITTGTKVTAFVVQEGGTEYVDKIYKADEQEDQVEEEKEQENEIQESVKRTFEAAFVRVGTNNKITVIEDGDVKAYTVEEDAIILWNGSVKSLSQIPEEAVLSLYTEDDKVKRLTVLEVPSVEEKGEFVEFVSKINAYILTFSQNGLQRDIEVDKGVKITRNNRSVEIEDLRVGDELVFVIEEDEITKIVATSTEEDVKGRISSILLGLTPEITVQVEGEAKTYVLGTDTEIYDRETRTSVNLKELQIGSTVELEVSSKQVTYIEIEKVPSVLSYKGVIQEAEDGGEVLYVLVEYDILTGKTMIEKTIKVPIETLIMMDDKASRRSLLEEDMEILVLFDYEDPTTPTKVIVINK